LGGEKYNNFALFLRKEIKKRMADSKGVSVEISTDTSKLDLAIEKAKQLKSLLLEVKELSASIDVDFKVNDKRI
jgi:hypothetical protein